MRGVLVCSCAPVKEVLARAVRGAVGRRCWTMDGNNEMPEYCVVVVRGATGERAARLSTTREHRSGAQRVSERDEFSLLSAAGRRGGGGGVRPTSVRYDAAAVAVATESYYRVSSRRRRTHLNDLPVGRPSTGIYEDLRRSFVTRRWSIRGATRSFAFYSEARRHVPAPSGRPVFTV